MKADLVDELVCPECRGPLTLHATDSHGGDIEAGTLSCACGRAYPIRDGIPRLLPARLASIDARIAAAFGYEWTHFTIDYEGATAHFLDWIAPLQPADFQGKRVVDAGCGMGRHARAAARFGATHVFAIDLSEAVDVARQYTSNDSAVHVIQADLRQPPLRGGIDLVYSIGVLNQLPDPQTGFTALTRLLGPGGRLCAWVYAAEAGRAVSAVLDPLRAHVTSRLPFPVLRVLTWLPAAILALTCRGIVRPLLRRRPTLHSRRPWLGYLAELGGFPFSLLHCTLFDQLVAPAARYCTRDELAGYFGSAGLRDVRITARHGNGWRGLGTAPGDSAPSVTSGRT